MSTHHSVTTHSLYRVSLRFFHSSLLLIAIQPFLLISGQSTSPRPNMLHTKKRQKNTIFDALLMNACGL